MYRWRAESRDTGEQILAGSRYHCLKLGNENGTATLVSNINWISGNQK